MFWIVTAIVVALVVVFYTKLRGPGGILQSARNLGIGAAAQAKNINPALQAEGKLQQMKDALDDGVKKIAQFEATVEGHKRRVKDIQIDITELEARRDFRIAQNDADGATEAQEQIDRKTESLARVKETLDHADTQLKQSKADAKAAQQRYQREREEIKDLTAESKLAEADAASQSLLVSFENPDGDGELQEIKERARQRIDASRAESRVTRDVTGVGNRSAEDQAIRQSSARAKIDQMMKSRPAVA